MLEPIKIGVTLSGVLFLLKSMLARSNYEANLQVYWLRRLHVTLLALCCFALAIVLSLVQG